LVSTSARQRHAAIAPYKIAPYNFPFTACVQSHKNYLRQLHAWTTLAEPNEQREEAASIIKNWIRGRETQASLNLDGLGLKKLPPIPRNCQELSADYNQLKVLPEHLPTSLLYLSVENNGLVALPKELPPQLKSLHVAHNALKRFTSDLPDSLEMLDIAHNAFRFLPHHYPSHIKNVFAGHNLIEVCPKSLLHYPLENLDLPHNRFERLPHNIDLSPIERINLSNNPLTNQTLHALATRQNGPQISYSISDGQATFPDEPLWKAIAHLMNGRSEKTIDQQAQMYSAWKAISEEPGAQDFAKLISRLASSIQASAPGFTAFADQWLEALAANPMLRQRTFLLASDAAANCEDRVAFTLNEMKKVRILDNIESGQYDHQISSLLNLARGMFRLNLLERVAREKTKSLASVDEIEVFLAYQVKLRQTLHLPLDVNEMRFFSASSVTKDDLKHAQFIVMQNENKEFERYFLTECSIWRSALKRIDGAGFQQAKDKIEQEKKGVHERLQKTLAHLERNKLSGWVDATKLLVTQFETQINAITYKEMRSLTEKIFNKRNVPITSLAPVWRPHL